MRDGWIYESEGGKVRVHNFSSRQAPDPDLDGPGEFVTTLGRDKAVCTYTFSDFMVAQFAAQEADGCLKLVLDRQAAARKTAVDTLNQLSVELAPFEAKQKVSRANLLEMKKRLFGPWVDQGVGYLGRRGRKLWLVTMLVETPEQERFGDHDLWEEVDTVRLVDAMTPKCTALVAVKQIQVSALRTGRDKVMLTAPEESLVVAINGRLAR